MRNLLEDRSKMSSSLNSVSVPIALSTLARPTIRSYLNRTLRTWLGCLDPESSRVRLNRHLCFFRSKSRLLSM